MKHFARRGRRGGVGRSCDEGHNYPHIIAADSIARPLLPQDDSTGLYPEEKS